MFVMFDLQKNKRYVEYNRYFLSFVNENKDDSGFQISVDEDCRCLYN